MARRGYLTLASSRHSWRDSSVVTWRWWSRSTRVQRVQVIFGSRQLQADQPVERANVRSLKKTCWLSFGTGVRALGGPGRGLAGSEEGLLDSVRFVAGKIPLKDFKALGSGPIEVIRSR